LASVVAREDRSASWSWCEGEDMEGSEGGVRNEGCHRSGRFFPVGEGVCSFLSICWYRSAVRFYSWWLKSRTRTVVAMDGLRLKMDVPRRLEGFRRRHAERFGTLFQPRLGLQTTIFSTLCTMRSESIRLRGGESQPSRLRFTKVVRLVHC
jgi:hypothetical protein